MGPTASLLERRSLLDSPPLSSSSGSLTPLQSQVDGLVGGFVEQATDWRSLAAMTAGGMTYRLGRMGVMATGAGHLASIGIGLGAEVTAFEMTNRSLASLTGDTRSNPNLWRWDGNGGIRQGLLSSLITFGSLKGAGSLAQGENAVVQHLLQDTGMVLGHQVSGSLGITDRPQGTLAEQFLHAEVTNLQLSGGMALAHGVAPGIPGIERGLDLSLRTTEGTPLLQNGLQPAFATAGNAGSAPSAEREDVRGPTTLHMASHSESGGNPEPPRKASGSFRRIRSLFPSSYFPGADENTPTPTTIGGGDSPGSGKKRRPVERIMGVVTILGRKLNLNANFDPEAPLPPARTEAPVSPVRSVREGIDRAHALGHDRRTIAFLRWGASQLRNEPEIQRRFLDHMERIFTFQTEMRNHLDPILQGLPEVDWQETNEAARRYREALEGIAPRAGPHYTEALLLDAQLRSLRTAEDYLSLTDNQLREMGIEPKTLASLERNAHAFSERELLQRLNHPLLRDLPETETFRQALHQFQSDLQNIRVILDKICQNNKTYRDRIAATEDVNERKALEAKIREEAETVNDSYEHAARRLNDQMRIFLSDPLRARVLLVENARLSSLVRGLQDLDRATLVDRLGPVREFLTGEARAAADELLLRSQELDLVSNRGPLTRLFFGAVRYLNLDPHSPLLVRGRYEKALLKLIQEAPPDFWRFEEVEPPLLEQAISAQRAFYQSHQRLTENLRQELEVLENDNDAFWKHYDETAASLYVEDLRLQLAQARSEVERAREALGSRFSQAGKKDKPSLSEQYENLLQAADEAIGKVADPALLQRSSRSFNRTMEVALRSLSHLRGFARKALRTARLPGADFKAVSALALPYAEKKDAVWWRTRIGESARVGLPVLWHTLPKVAQLASSVKRGESVSVLDRRFEEWAVQLMLGQHLYISDPETDSVVEQDALILPGNHNSWLDFLRGSTPGARAAQLRGRDSHRDALRILAKQGLGKLVGPVFEEAIELLTESVGDSSPEYDGSITRAARAMAFGDMPGERLGPRSAAAYDELTMSVTSLIHPFAFDPFPAISSILRIPQGGRSFNIADRAAALTGRFQNLLLTSTLNAYRLWPKPDRPFPLRRGDLTTVTELMPYLSLAAPEANGENGAGVTRSNWLRTYWLRMASTPEYDRPIPSIDRTFRDYQNPQDAGTEEVLRNMFGGMLDVYPTAEGAARRAGRVESLRTELTQARAAEAGSPEGTRIPRLKSELAVAERAQVLYETEVVQLRLREAMAELQTEESQPYAADYPGIRRYRQALRGRLKDMAKIEEAFREGRDLTSREQDRWHRLRTSYLGDETNGYQSKIQQHLNLLREVQGGSHATADDPLLAEMRSRQETYLNHLNRIARAERGEEPGVTAEELEAQRFVLEQPYRDAVEAYYFLKGHMPSGWDLRVARADRPSTWLSAPLLNGLQFFLKMTGVEPASWDGAIFSSVRRRWENGTLVMEPVNPRPETGLSKRALYSILLETIRFQLAVVKTVGIDPEGRNFDGIVPGWLYSITGLAGTKIRIEGLENLRGLRDENLITVWTHRGMSEYPFQLGLQDLFGHPLRILADEKFRKNPVIRGLVGMAMVLYNFFFIDRSSSQKGRETMTRIGEQLKSGIASIALFPGMSRTPTMVFDGERVEGPLYQNRAGVGATARAAGDPWIVPVALNGTGKMTPSSLGEQKRGIPMGETVTVRVGRPFLSSEVLQPITGSNPKRLDMEALKQDRDLALRIDQEFAELTGLPTGPLYTSKPKSIFQANDLTQLHHQLSDRLSPEWTWKISRGLKHPSNLIPHRERPTYKDSAVVLHPSMVRSPELDGQVTGILRELDLPQGRQLTVFYSRKKENGEYRFTPVNYRRKRGEEGFEIVEGRSNDEQ